MAKPIPQVVLFGDSLFQGSTDLLDGFSFQAALQSHCIRRLDVVNRGLSGYNTSQALKALPDMFVAPSETGPHLEYLFILFGANDACVRLPTNTQQHVPLDTFAANLRALATHPLIAAHRPRRVFLVTPPPLDEIRTRRLDLASGHPASQRQAKVSAAYSEAVRRVAAELEGAVELVDLYKAIMDVAVAKTTGAVGATGSLLGDPECGQRGHLEHLLPDGLHMSGEAYRIFFAIVKPLIGKEWEEAPPEDRAGYVLPDWRVASPR
ncbi:hypothetical protein P8C59_004804 [Phyllachora maydis]|uniref:SGNH hydrolase-type esterase domain-containing protein n=1 Tax=Phyllachora maydis TaxID=1825666 RepID=A0AAD9I334_9PEZI|nr:hypothetical protein P8C59_004804 [Phyllachora maydis]